MKVIKDKLQQLRDVMRREHVDAVIIPGTDPHSSEYFADYWKEREWITGFNGSAGTAVVTLDKAGLWTDSRYFLQAAQQLKYSTIELFKDGLYDTPTIINFLKNTLSKGSVIAVNAQMFSIQAIEQMAFDMEQSELKLDTAHDFIGEIWVDRPKLPHEKIILLDTKYAGMTISDKLTAIRQKMTENAVDVLLFSGLDEIAWIFNIRGTDVLYNPVVIAYAAIENNDAKLFVDNSKLTDSIVDELARQGVSVRPYESVCRYLDACGKTTVVGMDFGKINYALYQQTKGVKKHIPSVVIELKSRKNAIELSGISSAMIRDGVAMVKFLKWLEEHVVEENLTEISVARKLREIRAQQPLFFGESFATIAGYASHGAIVHYSATPDSDAELHPCDFLLLDSGAQYLDGTTDITRTIPLGAISEQQRRDFTLVLKGHIALASAIFPYGTRGSQLDVLARQFLWQNALNYGHGTGHGVGHFLCVHEGPQNIRTEENPTRLETGMIISNEPGLYRTDAYGIRIENLVAVVEKTTSDFGRFLAFETLTLCPISKEAVDKSLLTDFEIKWLNNYHKTVYERISPCLDESEKAWLKQKTEAI